ncbi:MAG: glyoxalase superfamily protein [Acidobacteriota bacterium]
MQPKGSQTVQAFGPVIPTLRVASMRASLAFYTDVLGFEIKWSWSNESRYEVDRRPELACLEGGEAVLFVARHRGCSDGWLFVELPFSEDVDALAEQLSGHQSVVELPIDKPWGSRELLLRDPDGHHLRFSCPVQRRREAID